MIKHNRLLLFSLIVVVGIIGVFFYKNKESAISARQTMIHEKGLQVMPFDLSQATHIFKKTNDGGIQRVIAKDKNNTQQISLIRMHLQMEVELFQKEDFTDPSKIHGDTMPGVQELSKGAKNITISYTDLPDGGQINYSTKDANLITAIHQWFDAQVSDHGNDARSS